MKNPEEIIQRMATNEGLPYDRQAVVDLALRDLEEGADIVYSYDDVVFTVEVSSGLVHMYSLGEHPTALLAAARRFAVDVWSSGFTRLFAPILNPKLARCALLFGWRPVQDLPTGHTLFMLERKPQ